MEMAQFHGGGGGGLRNLYPISAFNSQGGSERLSSRGIAIFCKHSKPVV